MIHQTLGEEDHRPAYRLFDEVFRVTRYPAGETHVQLRYEPGWSPPLVVEAHARDFNELCTIVTADRIFRSHGYHHVHWFVPYFPFARDDRRIDNRHGLELRLAMEIVDEIDIVIADPHSDVSGQLRHIDQASSVACFEKQGLFDGAPLFAIPDAGATRKAMTWVNGSPWVQCSKKRDPDTGKLSGFHCPERDLEGSPVVIVDDICDGGGTFLGLAEELKRCNAGPLTLAVTHGLFTKGRDILHQHFERIYTFDNRPSPVDVQIVIPYQTLYHAGTQI